MNRHLSRMVSMQTLYEWEFRGRENLGQITERNIAEYKKDVDADFIHSIVAGASRRAAATDQQIAKSAPEWPLDQISLIDKTILRLAIFELTSKQDTPPKVIINEAVELAKQFGGENSSKFVNGVLGSIYAEIKEDQPA
ncbi:MAG: transcription antitermination factor NusB [Patescibacteria group bacterium]